MGNQVRWAAVLGLGVALVAALCAGTTQAAPSGSVTIAADVGCSAYGYWGWGLPPATGTFSATGAVGDSGRVYGPNTYPTGGAPPTPLSLSGASGSLTVSVTTGQWSVVDGSGEYAGLSGGGAATVTTTVHTWFGWILGYSYTYSLTGSVN